MIILKFLNKKNYLFQLKNQNNHYIYNSNFYKINITEKIRKLRDYRRKKNKTIT